LVLKTMKTAVPITPADLPTVTRERTTNATAGGKLILKMPASPNRLNIPRANCRPKSPIPADPHRPAAPVVARVNKTITLAAFIPADS
jgi:hypothetical protein